MLYKKLKILLHFFRQFVLSEIWNTAKKKCEIYINIHI